MGVRFDEAQARIEAFLRDWPEAEFGPAHVLLSDYNLEDFRIDRCLAELESAPPDLATGECGATADLLRSLKDIPEDDRCPDR